jgi:hypothetical protein
MTRLVKTSFKDCASRLDFAKKIAVRFVKRAKNWSALRACKEVLNECVKEGSSEKCVDVQQPCLV